MNDFLEVNDKRAGELITEIRNVMTEAIRGEPEDGMTRGQLWEMIFAKTTASSPAEYFILGLNAQRMLEEHFAQEALHALGDMISQPLKGRKAD